MIDFGDAYNPFTTPPNLTIAGQTAPGNGIMLRGISWIPTDTSHIIARHLRVRGKGDPDKQNQLLGVYNSHDIIYDHLSYGWNNDDALWASYGSDRVTFQWILGSEGGFDDGGSFDQSGNPIATGGYNKCCATASTNASGPTFGGISFLHSFFAQFQNRVPWASSTTVQFINNVVYNVGDGSAIFSNGFSQAPQADWENNYYKTGPQQPDGSRVSLALASACHVSEGTGCTQQFYDWAVQSKIYLSGNFHNTLRPNNTYPEGAFTIRWYVTALGAPLNIVPTKPAHFPAIPSMVPAASVPGQLGSVGAYATLGRRDAVDQRAIDSFTNNTGGSLNCASLVGVTGCCSNGVCGETGSYPAGTPYPDADGDGMSDAYETGHGLNPNNAADGPALAPGGGGYTNLELFLNELAGDGGVTPPAAITLHWPLDDGPTGTTADTGGGGFAGTVIGGPTWTAGVVGPGSVTLNGSTQFIQNTGFTWPAGSPITAAFWIKTSSGATGGGAWGIGGQTAPNLAGCHVPYADNRVYCYYGQFSPPIDVDYTAYLGKWTHVAYTNDGLSQAVLYLNGTAVQTTASASAPTSALTGVTFGEFVITGTPYTTVGRLDDFRLENRVWTAAEVLSAYQAVDVPLELTISTASGSTTAASVMVVGEASDGTGVTSIGVNCTPTCGTPTVTCTPACGAAAPRVDWSVSVPLTAGSNGITVTANDAAAHTASQSVTIVRNVPVIVNQAPPASGVRP